MEKVEGALDFNQPAEALQLWRHGVQGIISDDPGLMLATRIALRLALRSLRRAVETWHHALAQRSPLEGPAFDRVELLSWRTLGEGLLLIDMYEQGENVHSEPAARAKPGTWQRALAWLRRRRK